MQIKTCLPIAALLAAGLAWTSSPAAAESHELASTTVGYMTEQADVVVLAEATAAGEDGSRRFRVTEVLRGDSAAQTVLEVTGADASAEPRAGTGYLLFLTRAADGRHAPLSRFAVRETEGIGGLVAYARGYAAALGTSDPQARRDALRGLLVTGLASSAGGVPFSAGTDLVRRVDLHGEITPADRERIAAALRTQRKADLDLAGVIEAAGLLGDRAVEASLVERLLDPDVQHLRRYVTGALARRTRPELVANLVGAIEKADARQRGNLANALGRMGAAEAERPLLALLRDDDSLVRIEAAHALGRVARAVRRKPADPEAADAPRPRLASAVAPLLALARRSDVTGEQKAAVWAVAQVDTAAAWKALEDLAADETARPRVRRFATDYRKRPRVELILK